MAKLVLSRISKTGLRSTEVDPRYILNRRGGGPFLLNDWARVCCAVIPCHNEQATIGSLVQAVKQVIPNVWVVDDGSADRTAEVARKAGAKVISQAISLGKGAALMAGWSQALETGFDWALCLDGDGQHAAEDIGKFFVSAEKTGAALVVGNRMHDAGRMPVVRRWVNRFMSWQLSRLSRGEWPDSQCGFRLMNLHHWARLPIQSTHFEIESEVLLQFATAGLRVEFVPIQVIYKQEQSKIHPVKDTVRWLLWRFRANGGRPAARSAASPVKAEGHGY